MLYTLSNETEMEIIDVKVIYDRLKQISKNDWSKIFYNHELANLKPVQKSITKNETIKRGSCCKCFKIN